MFSLPKLLRAWKNQAAARRQLKPSRPATGLFKGSFQLRHLDAGSCNACELELIALAGPHYDSARLGIDFTASPRHADALVMTGPVTRNLAEAVELTIAATPRPRLVIACGDCAAGNGPFAGSYAVAGRSGHAADADVTIPGCPPRPESILGALAEARSLDG